MKHVTTAILALALGAAWVGNAAAAEEAKAATPQQTRMKNCNKEAGDQQLKGEARKEFMRGCLSGKNQGMAKGAGAADRPECAAKANDATGKPLAGAARASFMKKCVADMQASAKP
jgi:hypothetical protein